MPTNDWRRITREEYNKVIDFMLAYPGTLNKLRKYLSTDRALELAEKGRDQVIVSLRIEHGWSLDQIAEIFGLTRERIRQLTPSGIWSKRYDLPGKTEEEMVTEVLSMAVHTSEAWTRIGQLSKKWAIGHFGHEYSELTLRRTIPKKFETILHYGLGLTTKESKLQWIRQKYYREGMPYRRIAELLSRDFINIATMAVYKGCVRIGFKGHARGRRPDTDRLADVRTEK